MYTFFASGHNFYIASAFIFSTVVLMVNLWLPFRRYRKIMQQQPNENKPLS